MERLRPQIDEIEGRRLRVSSGLLPDRRRTLGQFFTPYVVARFMASMFSPPHGEIRLLDAGAGIGMLSCAVCSLLPVSFVEAWEVDQSLVGELFGTLALAGVRHRIVVDDFLTADMDSVADFSHVILNPPYGKLKSGSSHWEAAEASGVSTSNLYTAFLVRAAARLRPGGQMVAIVPRSFFNGAYHRAVRHHLLSMLSLDAVHVFESRRDVFKDDSVLQENVIVRFSRAEQAETVEFSFSDGASFDSVRRASVAFSSVVAPMDVDKVFRLPFDAPAEGRTLADMGIQVSTGPVVEFRSRDQLTSSPTGAIPLVRSRNISSLGLAHPLEDGRPAFISRCPETESLLFPAGDYVLVKRITAKESPRRLVALHYTHSMLSGPMIAFENHLNVLHASRVGLDPALAARVTEYLNSDQADSQIRAMSGSTQVNASDLRKLLLPSKLGTPLNVSGSP